MIHYNRGGGVNIFFKVFQCKGSVFPTSFAIALPCAIVTSILRLVMDHGYLLALTEYQGKRIIQDNVCFSSFTFLVGFLVVFRTSQAYARFWDGCTATHQMRAEWWNACSALVSFCKFVKFPSEASVRFQHLLVRLFSMLHAVALADIEDSNKDEVSDVAAFRYELVDGGGIDQESLRVLKHCDAKVELIIQWIQQLIVENIQEDVLSIPAPILSRAFQEIANGMVAFHEAIKISTIPFPFPYAQMCECLLMMHWLVTPIVVAQYVATPWWAGLFTFLLVFVYWSLNGISVEIENPFGMDANDIDAATMQCEMNRHLMLLLEAPTRRTPQLAKRITTRVSQHTTHSDLDKAFDQGAMLLRRKSLMDLWSVLDQGTPSEGEEPARPVRRVLRSSASSNASSEGGRRSYALSQFSQDGASQFSQGGLSNPRPGGNSTGSQNSVDFFRSISGTSVRFNSTFDMMRRLSTVKDGDEELPDGVDSLDEWAIDYDERHPGANSRFTSEAFQAQPLDRHGPLTVAKPLSDGREVITVAKPPAAAGELSGSEDAGPLQPPRGSDGVLLHVGDGDGDGDRGASRAVAPWQQPPDRGDEDIEERTL